MASGQGWSLGHVLIQIRPDPFTGKGSQKEKTIKKKREMFKEKMTSSDFYKMSACSSCSADLAGKGQSVFEKIRLIGMSHRMIYVVSLDLLQRGAGGKLILPDGVPNIYMHCRRGQMFLCVVGCLNSFRSVIRGCQSSADVCSQE